MLKAERQSVRDLEAVKVRVQQEKAAELAAADKSFFLGIERQSIKYIAEGACGNLVALNTGGILLEQNGKVTKYSGVAALRNATGDGGAWTYIKQAERRLRIMRQVAEHIPKQV